MVRRCLLHIGMNKTGSTSIQHTFDHYADGTWRYLDLGSSNHSHLLALAFREAVPANIQADLALNAPGLTRDEARQRFHRALALDDRSVVVSAEGMSIFSATDVQALIADLREHVDEVRCLGYVRDPVGLVSSNFQQVLRRSLPKADHATLLPNYRKRFGCWIQAIGPDAVTLVPFHSSCWAERDLLIDFARRAGLSEDHARTAAQRKNTALSAEATALLYAYRLRASASSAGPKKREQRSLKLLRLYGTRKFTFSVAGLAAGLDRISRQVDWVEARMGRPFPATDQGGRMRFDSPGALIDYAGGLGADLATFLAARKVRVAADPSDPVVTLQRLVG